MWDEKSSASGGPLKFFCLSLARDSLENFYKTNFALMQYHKYSLSDIENMLPWEREIYIMLLIEHIREENERMREQVAQRRMRR